MCKKIDDGNRTFDEKDDDNKTFEEKGCDDRPWEDKYEDFFYNKPWKMILYTFSASLAIFFLSLLVRNKGGTIVIFSYPISLIFYALEIIQYKKFLLHNL